MLYAIKAPRGTFGGPVSDKMYFMSSIDKMHFYREKPHRKIADLSDFF